MMRTLRPLAPAALLLALVAWPGTSGADESTKPYAVGVSPENQDLAMSHYRDGNDKFAADNCAAALIEYRLALAVWDHPAVHYNIAMCLIDIRAKPLEIYAHLEKALKFGSEPVGEDAYREGQRYLQLLQSQLARITIVAKQPGIEITVDGTSWLAGAGRAQGLLSPGRHQLVASKPGYETLTRHVEVEPGKAQTLKIEVRRFVAPLEAKPRWSPWKPWVITGAGSALVAAAIPLTILSRRAADEYDDRVRAECPGLAGCAPGELSEDAVDLREKAQLESRLAVVGFAVGGVALVGGLTLVVLNRPRIDDGRIGVAPIVSSDVVGFAAAARF